MDTTAQLIIAHLDRETSSKWEDLAQISNSDWPAITRAVALLVWADWCQPGSKRIRLTETGVKLLDDSKGAQIA